MRFNPATLVRKFRTSSNTRPRSISPIIFLDVSKSPSCEPSLNSASRLVSDFERCARLDAGNPREIRAVQTERHRQQNRTYPGENSDRIPGSQRDSTNAANYAAIMFESPVNTLLVDTRDAGN